MNNKLIKLKNIALPVSSILMALLLYSCKVGTVVKKYPAGQPFFYETEVKVADKTIGKEERSKLETGLYGQLDDSLKARKLDKLFWSVLKNPGRLDSSLIGKSLQFMHYFLQAQGYFNDTITYTTEIKPKADQQRVYTNFDVWPGKVTRIDSLSYDLNNDSLQQLTASNLKEAFIRKGDPFAQAPISTELDRLVELFREHGYLKFSRDLLYGLWDTLDVSLLQPSLDPFEQAAQLAKLRARKDNPMASLDIRLRPLAGDDSLKLTKYYVGKIYVYPDNAADTTGQRRETTIDNITVVQYNHKFKPKVFPPNIYLKQGDLYNQRRYMRTINRFNTIGSWRLVEMDQHARAGQDTVDFVLKMLPAKKYSFTTSAEGSISQGSLSGDFVGLGFNIGVQNRNFARAANLASSNLRYGVELGEFKAGSFVQTQQLSLSNSISYPRFIFPGMKKFKDDFRGNIRSVFSLNGANTERRYLFNWTTINSSWGYEFTRRRYTLGLRLPNIEYSYLVRRDSLEKLIAKNPSIKNLFSDGLISSLIVNFTMPWGERDNKVLNVFRANMEESGGLTGLIRNKFIDEQLYRFIKIDAEYARLIKWTKTSFVVRGFAGIGYEFESTRNPDKRDKLPFFKQYYSGGPNSMRAWQLRRLGPGSSLESFKGSEYSVPERFGDVQLEVNAEYRLPLFKMAGIPINGAVFTDMGNIWLLKKNAGDPDEIFKLSRLGTDLAIGSGAGVRVDLGFFVIRLDWGYKVKDPSPDPANIKYRNKFFAYPFIKGSQLQIGIGYPFIF